MTNYTKYLNRPNSAIPIINQEIYSKGVDIPYASVLNRKNINDLLDDGYLENENGYYHHHDGSTYVAVLTKMPNVTIEMIDWWFWWHATDSVRYQIWYPEKHFEIKSDWGGFYNDESKSYRERLDHSTHYVTEVIGVGKETLAIDFMSSEAFGFDIGKMRTSKMGTIFCAKAGFYDKGVWTADMCHAVRITENGLEMRSRFWIGNEIDRMNKFGRTIINNLLNKPFIKRRLIPKNIGRHLFFHCTQEFNNLSSILSELYQEENK